MTYLFRRLVFTAVVLVGVTLITFLISHALPIDPVSATLGEGAARNPSIVAAYRAKWGLDQPLPLQYITYLNNLVHGDLGLSLFSHRPVGIDISEYLPATTELATLAILIGLAGAIPLGITAAMREGTAADTIVRGLTIFGVSMPIFWLAMVGLEVRRVG